MTARDLRTRLVSDDGGVSLVELSVGMLITALMSALMISWVFSIAAADDLHLADDEAVQGLRIAKDEITRELRRTTEVVTIGADSFTIWIDENRDDGVTVDEYVTWSIDSEGDLIRATGDGAPSVRLSRLSPADSAFAYDASLPAEVTSVEVTLTVFVEAPRGDEGVRSLTIEVSLRGTS